MTSGTGPPGDAETRAGGEPAGRVAEKTPPVPPLAGTRKDELVVSAMFLLSAAGAVWFFVTYWIFAGQTNNAINAMLGIALAITLGALGFGAIMWAKKLMAHEVAVEQRHPFGSPPEESKAAAETFQAGVAGTNIVRRPILRRSLLLASGALVLPLIAPLRSLGPKPTRQLSNTRWSAGARLVLADGTPVKLGDLRRNGIATVLPEGHTDVDAQADSSVLLINIGANELTNGTRPKSVEGYVAYSQVCTHAGCPARLYDQQTRVIVCPCHQSQFDVVQGCKPVAGPASRSLPQLAIKVDADGYFRAVRDFDEPVGPGYWTRG